MNLKGKLKHKNIFLDCSLLISNGKLYELNIDDADTYFDFILGTKEHSSDYVLEKIIDTKNSPINSNYLLKYFGGYEKPFLIYLKLNLFEKYKLDFAMKQTLIQSKDIKIEILKYFIFAVFGFLSGKIVYEPKNIENKTPAAIPKNVPIAGPINSLEPKNLKTDNKKDTIIINNLKNASHLKGGETKPK